MHSLSLYTIITYLSLHYCFAGIKIRPAVRFQYLFFPNSTLIREGVNFFKGIMHFEGGPIPSVISTDISTQDAAGIDPARDPPCNCPIKVTILCK